MKRTADFRCKRCGSCCRISPFLSVKDINRIKKEGYAEEYFVETLRGQRFMKMHGDGCVFLNDIRSLTACKIYQSRPDICRKYPTEIRENGDCRPEVLRFDKTI